MIVAAVKIWNYRKPESNTVSTPDIIKHTSDVINKGKPVINERCPICSKFTLFQYNYKTTENSGRVYLLRYKKCINCGWTSSIERTPLCI